MPQAQSASIENNFTAGLKTEFTGLNFPENAATDADNVVFEYTGDVVRRLGFDYEANFGTAFSGTSGNYAMNTYLWTNAGGDGVTQLLVQQFGGMLHFYKATAATVASPLSTKKLVATVTLSTFLVSGSGLSINDIQCEFSDGNGFLFVYHPHLESFYCTYDPAADSIVPSPIVINIRDFDGIGEVGVSDTQRPGTLTDFHKYNLINQGWVSGAPWAINSNSVSQVGATQTWTVPSGLTITPGTRVTIKDVGVQSGWDAAYIKWIGVVTSYSGTTLVITINNTYPTLPGWQQHYYFALAPINIGYIDKWFTDTGFYPSNSDVWWNFKNSSDVFDPATTLGNVTIGSPAPKGSIIFSAFNQNRNAVVSLTSLYNITTNIRPRTGTWFQGRVWYTGVDAYQSAVTNVSPFYTWTESIYFSQIVQTPAQFGLCHQTNDPTSETLSALLPTDGGVIKIQGAGAIYKLFPIQNGMLVFAANGIWFITGSQGIGFTANDYTITKISNIRSISSTSFVNVQGLPMFWNEEGIYTVQPAQQGLGLTVESLTYNSIDSLYADIPVSSKQFARGDYNPIDYIVQWTFRDTVASTVHNRYLFNRILCFNIKTKAFYTYTLPTSTVNIHGVNYIPDYGLNSPTGIFKYLTSVELTGSDYFTFAEERDEDYRDWHTPSVNSNYISYFVTGYKLRGQAQRQWQTGYVLIYSRNDEDTSYKIQGIFDYAISPNSGRYSSNQVITNNKPNFGMVVRRHKLRGQGYAGQIKVTSVDGEPFDIMGWSIYETSNAGV